MGRVERLGIFGGTFDPIHVGHLLMAQTVYEALGLGQVLFVPAGKAPHRRPKESTEAGTRVAMVRAAIEGDARFALSTVDVDRLPPHYTAETLALLGEQYQLDPDRLYFIVGSDSLAMLHTWYRPDLVVTRCRLAVTFRPGYPVDLPDLVRRVPEAADRVDVVEMPTLGISSTLLRDMVSKGRSIRYWVPDVVESMVQEAGLYRQVPEPGAVTTGRSR